VNPLESRGSLNSRSSPSLANRRIVTSLPGIGIALFFCLAVPLYRSPSFLCKSRRLPSLSSLVSVATIYNGKAAESPLRATLLASSLRRDFGPPTSAEWFPLSVRSIVVSSCEQIGAAFRNLPFTGRTGPSASDTSFLPLSASLRAPQRAV